MNNSSKLIRSFVALVAAIFAMGSAFAQTPHLNLFSIQLSGADKVVWHVTPDAKASGTGTLESPMSFPNAIGGLNEFARHFGFPDGGIEIVVHGGRYPIDQRFVLGEELFGTPNQPCLIRAAEGEQVFFDGGIPISADQFARVSDPADVNRLAATAVGKALVAKVDDPRIVKALSRKVITTLTIGDQIYLPSVFPNDGYASFGKKMVVAEQSPPAITPGKEGYGIRAGHPPYQEPGRAQGWLGSIDEPRGAWAEIFKRDDERAGTWQQWQDELERNNRRCRLTGFIDANWLLKTQAVVAASAEKKAMRLEQALAYGWNWKQNDKPFKVFGLLCEMDQPGEWHFDVLDNMLYLIPPEGFGDNSRVSLPVAEGFIELRGAKHVSLIGLNVENIGAGYAYSITAGSNNLIAGATVRNSPAGGFRINGTNNRVQSCDLVDLNQHVHLGGGRRGEGVLESGGNVVENCHIYQKGFSHLKVNVSVTGVGNQFRHNLIHNSLGQAVVVNGNDHLLELNELFNIGYDEGDGGAIYSGADLIGYGNTYRHNFFHHLMHVPGKVERSGIHLDDCQAGATCDGNIFYKSAAKGVFMFGGAGHTVINNVFLEGYRGVYNVGTLGAKHYNWEQEIAADSNHKYRNTKENYLGRVERIIGKEGWAKEPWRTKYPVMYEVMSDSGKFGRMWPIRCRVENNLFYANQRGDHTIWSRFAPEVQAKSVIRGDHVITPDWFVNYQAMDFRFKPDQADAPQIPFDSIGLYADAYRTQLPDKSKYRIAVRKFFADVKSMPGTTRHFDSAILIESVMENIND